MTTETTDLERRLLAQERVLQVLIAHIGETEPKFLERLKAAFASDQLPWGDGSTLPDPHAGRFIRQVEVIGERRFGRADPDAKFVAQDNDSTARLPSSRALSPID